MTWTLLFLFYSLYSVIYTDWDLLQCWGREAIYSLVKEEFAT